MNTIGNPEERDATSIKIGLPEHDDNPCCSALPLLSRDELGKALNHKPPYSKSMRLLPPKVRKLACERVRNAFICIHRTLDFAESFQIMMRSSTLSRNPNDEVFSQWCNKLVDRLRTLGKDRKLSLKKKKKEIKNLLHTLACEESPSMSIWGLPASGKSGVVLRLLKVLYGDRVLKHTNEDGEIFRQVPFLYLHCPIGLSAKQAIINLLAQLGILVDETLVTEAMSHSSKSIEDFVLPELISYLLIYNVGAIIIDEVEMIKSSYSRGDEGLKNFWLFLMNCRIPIVLIGNPDGMNWFKDTFKLQHRMCGGGSTIYDKLPNDGGEFTFFLEHLWPNQFTSVETPLTEELITAMHRHSQGLIKILIRLYIWVQQLAITKGEMGGDEIITVELIEEAVRKKGKTIEAMLSGMEHGVEESELASDLRLAGLKDFVAKVNEGGKETNAEGKSAAPAPFLQEVESAKPKPRRTIRPGRKIPKRITDATKKQSKGEQTSYEVYKKLGKLESPFGA